MSQPALKVLSVCVGNICRSPVSALLLADAFGDLVESSSAGVRAVVGAGVHLSMAQRLEREGVPAIGTARQLTPSLIDDSDLVLTMTRKIRADVVGLAPGALRKTFTLPEFVTLLERGGLVETAPTTRDDLLDLIARAPAQRSLVAVEGSESLDIGDPYGGPDTGYEEAFQTIQQGVDLLHVLLTARRLAR